MDFWEALSGTFTHLAGLLVHLMVLFKYVLGMILAGGFAYLLLIRPLWGAITDRRKRLYWASLLFMLVFALFLGPWLIVLALKAYGELAGLGAIIAWGAIIWVTYKISGAEKIERSH